jgi:hypothetical protein
LAKIEGEWARFINIDDDCYWIHDEEKLNAFEKQPFTLPSDCHFREDLILYKMGLDDKASEAKVYLEEKQRKDEGIRRQK